MPDYPTRLCSCRPDCPNRIPRGQRFCSAGLQLRESARANPWLRRLYHTARWQRMAKAQLEKEPACADCHAKGRLEPATDVHHWRRPANEREFFNAAGLGSLCHRCHSVRTQRGE